MMLFPKYADSSNERKKEFVTSCIISGLLFVAFILITISVLHLNFISKLDYNIFKIKRHTYRGLSSHILLAIDDFGLRSFTATVLITSSVFIAYFKKSFRPINLSLLSLLALNLVVGVAKLSIGRHKPKANFDLIHSSGLSYPSGHAANALLSWGLLAYLLFVFFDKKWLKRSWLYSLVGAISLSMCLVSLMRNTHWFSDLIGGLLLGGSLLVAVIAIDRYFPSSKEVR